jgi:hypothetical protein
MLLSMAQGTVWAQVGSPGHQEGSFASYGPGGQRGNGVPIQAPILGSWMTRQPMQNGKGMILTFGEYAPNGNFRATSIVQGGTLNGMRMQVWGKYQIRQIGTNRYEMTSHSRGVAPQSFCTADGQCHPNVLPENATETIEMIDANSYHSKTTMNGQVTEADLHRSEIPPGLTTQVAAQVQLPAPPPSGGGAPVMPTLHPYVTPGGGNKTMGNNCDNLQQQRICAINNGHIYTDTRGCQVCASGN